MKKVVFLALVIGAASINPEARARSAPYVRAVTERLPASSPPHIALVLDPLFRWSAVNELRSIARELEQQQNSTNRLPHPSRFREYLQQSRVSGRTGFDPWGGAYYLHVRRDSILVGSPGPDMLPETQDDLRRGWSRF